MSDEPLHLIRLAPDDLDAFPSESATESATEEAQALSAAERPPPAAVAVAPTPLAGHPAASSPELLLQAEPQVNQPATVPQPEATPTHVKATVTDFPVQIWKPPAAHPPVVTNVVTLTELLDRQGGLDWRSAVAVVRQICAQLRDEESRAPIMLEGRNILINHEGTVRLLPGNMGGDPLVIQLGRLLRAMLMGNDAPPELRLLLAQATFELPIFESVDDVDRALRQLERLE